MKIGFSFGRCLRDIVNGTVDYEDVFLIVSRTAMFDSSHVDNVVEQYLNEPSYLLGCDEGKCYDIATRLYLAGKIYQPRVHGHAMTRVAENAIWMDLAPTLSDGTEQSEQVVKAWRNYQLALKMTALKMPTEPSHLKDTFNDDF